MHLWKRYRIQNHPKLEKPMGKSSITCESKNLLEYNSYYKELWQRSYRKIRTSLRIQKLFLVKDKLQNPYAFANLQSNFGFLDDLKRANTTPVKENFPTFVINPQGKFYLLWLTIMSLLLLYLAIVDPFFSIYSENSDTYYTDLVVDLVFICDFGITVCLAYYNEDGNLEKSNYKIFLNYLKSWMLIDLATSIPFGLISASQGGKSTANSLIKLLRLRNVPKLVRLTRLLKMLKQFLLIEDIDYFLSTHHKMIRFTKVIFVVFLCIHIVSCLFYLCAKLEEFGPETWIARYDMNDYSIAEKYQTSVYWAITTLATIGYGDIVPRTWSEKICAMLWMTTGVYIISYSVGSLTSFYSELSARESLLHKRILLAEDFTRKVTIPKKLGYQLKRSIKNIAFKAPKAQLDKFFRGIPMALRYEVAMNIYSGAIQRIPYFTSKDKAFVSSVALNLEQVCFSADQVVWNEKESSDCIYFIFEGRVKYFYQGLLFNIIQDGQYFGDVEVIYGIERKFKTVCSQASKTLKMSQEMINHIKELFPKIWKEMKLFCKKRLQNLVQQLAEMTVIKKFVGSGAALTASHSEVRFLAQNEYLKFYKNIKISHKGMDLITLKSQLSETKNCIQRLSKIIEQMSV